MSHGKRQVVLCWDAQTTTGTKLRLSSTAHRPRQGHLRISGHQLVVRPEPKAFQTTGRIGGCVKMLGCGYSAMV